MIIIKARFSYKCGFIFLGGAFIEIIITAAVIRLTFYRQSFLYLMAKNIRWEYISDEKQNI